MPSTSTQTRLVPTGDRHEDRSIGPRNTLGSRRNHACFPPAIGGASLREIGYRTTSGATDSDGQRALEIPMPFTLWFHGYLQTSLGI
jgi:hypothetical protein